MAFSAKQQTNEILEPEKQIQFTMAVENVDRMTAINLMREHDPMLYAQHVVNQKAKFES